MSGLVCRAPGTNLAVALYCQHMNDFRLGPPFYGPDPRPDRSGQVRPTPGGQAQDQDSDQDAGSKAEAVAPITADEIVDSDWLSVADAVAYCAARGLVRNIKTVRRWAHRSFAHPESAEVLVRKQDTETDFRYVIERSSLDVKIAQELAFDAQKKPARVTTPERTRPDMGGEATSRETQELPRHTEPDMSEHDRQGAEQTGDADDNAQDDRESSAASHSNDAESDAFLRQQIEEKDRQIGRLHTQLERRDEQIMSMLERDRETNILIKGLQEALLPASREEDDESRSRRLSVRSFDHGDSDNERDPGGGV